jgi:outer membrane protein assembly factor BamB
VGSFDKKLYCLKATSGEKVWEFATGGWVFSSPVVSNGYVYAGSDDGKVYCLKAARGDRGSWPMLKYNLERTGAVKLKY